MAHHLDLKFYAEQVAIKEKAKAESVAHKKKTWISLKNDEKDKIAHIVAQKIGAVPETMVFK